MPKLFISSQTRSLISLLYSMFDLGKILRRIENIKSVNNPYEILNL